MRNTKYPTNKLFRAAGIGYFTLFVLFILGTNYLPSNLRNSPMLEDIFMLGSGVLLSIITIIHSYYSWSLSDQEYTEWLESQKIGVFKADKVSSSAKSYTRELMMIIGPIGTIFSLILIVSTLIKILRYL